MAQREESQSVSRMLKGSIAIYGMYSSRAGADLPGLSQSRSRGSRSSQLHDDPFNQEPQKST